MTGSQGSVMGAPSRTVFNVHCTACNKRGFTSKKDAKRAMKMAWVNRHDGERREQNMYQCPESELWHLTKIPKGVWRD